MEELHMTLAPVRARTRLAAFVSLSLLLTPACSRREAPSGDAAPALPKDAVVVKVSYGSEKKGFLSDSIEAFHSTNPRTAKERTGHAAVRPAETRAIEDQ